MSGNAESLVFGASAIYRPTGTTDHLRDFFDGTIDDVVVADRALFPVEVILLAQADGDLFSWYKAHAEGLDVKIHDPNVWVSQIQGPRSLELLAAVLDGPMPDPFPISIAPRSLSRARPAGLAARGLPMSWVGRFICCPTPT